MDNNQKQKKNIKRPNLKPKFNFYWIYGAIFVVLIGFNFLSSSALGSKKLSQNKFENVLESGDVSKISIVNKSFALLYIKNEAASKEEYKAYTSDKKQLELLENGPKSLSQSWILGALYNKWKKMKGYKEPEPPDCQSSLKEWETSIKKYTE